MRQVSIALILIFAIGCTRKDVQLIRHDLDKNKCSVVSINADKENTDNFFMIKTFDENGILKHFRAQVGDPYGARHLFDYEISYSQGKATFKGSKKAFYWYPDNPPEDPEAPIEPNAPMHPEEDEYSSDTSDLEILFDHTTHYPIEVRKIQGHESLLKIEYNHRGFLHAVWVDPSDSNGRPYYAKTDQRGNILSILTPPLVEPEPYYGPQQLGVWYRYSDRSEARNKTQFYETPIMFISPQLSLLELLNWGPFQPDRERVHVTVQHGYGEEYLPSQTMDADYYNHQYDLDGNLVKYDFEGAVRRALPYVGHEVRQSGRSLKWRCSDRSAK